MTEQEKDRFVELLVESVDTAYISSGIWFLNREKSIELQKLLIEYDPKNKHRIEEFKYFIRDLQ